MRRMNMRVTWDVAVVVVIGVMVTGNRGACDVMMMMRMVMQWCCLSIVS